MSSRAALGRSIAGVLVLGAVCARAEGADRQWYALPVDGGLDFLARGAGLEAGLPSWRVLYEACGWRHGQRGEDESRPAEGAEPQARESAVPLPLAPAFWRSLLRDGDSVPDGRLALAIVEDPRAALLYRGLAGLDEQTLAALAADPGTLRRIERRDGDAFAAFGSRFAVRKGTVAVPAGPGAAPLWEALVGESPRSPAAFLAKLVERDEGRLAFLYDSLARLDDTRQRLALGIAQAGGAQPPASWQALTRAFEAESPWWRSERGAFARADVDAARVLREVRLAGDAVAAPASRAFWLAVFDREPTTREAVAASPPADLAWLAAEVGTGAPARRRLRLEQLAFAQRVFGAAAEQAPLEAIQALSGLEDLRALLLSLEREGARDPAFFAAAVAGARSALAILVPDELAHAQAGFQGALGVIDRARFGGTIATDVAEGLVRSLVRVPLREAVDSERGLPGWVERTLVPVLAGALGTDAGDPDRTLLRAMAGGSSARRAPAAFDWEGLWYRAQPERAELLRLERVRQRQGGRSLAEALRACRAEGKPERRPCVVAVGEALTSLVYAAHLGDPDGPALRGEDPARRHRFLPDPWALPVEVSKPGLPWHVEGSLLGLETALARLRLHRLDPDQMPERPPLLDPTQCRWLAEGAGLGNATAMRDEDRDTLARAVAAGRRRVQGLVRGSADLEPVAKDAGLDPWRARALEWLLEHDPEALASFFSLGELLHLGEPEGRWDGWGAADAVVGGLSLRLPPARPLDDAAGRAPEPALAEGFVDLWVRVAVHLSSRELPASLAPALVSTLLPDLFLEARPVRPDDRFGLDAWVRAQTPERLDDAVASLVGRGPLQPAPAPGRAR